MNLIARKFQIGRIIQLRLDAVKVFLKRSCNHRIQHVANCLAIPLQLSLIAFAPAIAIAATVPKIWVNLRGCPEPIGENGSES